MEYRRWKCSLTSILFLATTIAMSTFSAPDHVHAQSHDAPVVFSRTTIRVHPKTTENYIPESLEPFTLRAEIRPLSYFKNPGLYIAGMLREEEAYLIPLSPDHIHWLEYANIFSPMDIVVITHHGIVKQIFPEFVLSNITQPIQLPPGSAAALFLAPGKAKKLGIAPHFMVENELFSRLPEVVQ